MSELRSEEHWRPTGNVPPTPDPPRRDTKPWDAPSVSISTVDSPASMILLDMADQAGLSIIVPPNVSDQLLTVDLRDVPARDAFDRVGALLDYAPYLTGGTVHFEPIDRQVSAFTVFRAGHAETTQLSDALRAVAGPEAVVATFGDRMVVAGSQRAVDAANELADGFLTGPDGWRLEVRVVSISDTLRRQLGFDWDLSAEAAISPRASTGDLAGTVLTGASAGIVVRVLAEATEQGTEAFVETSATLYVLEGGQASINQGDRVPIPRFQTSPEGTTTVVGFDYIETGFTLDASAQRVPGGVRLALEPVISNVTGFVEQAPITTESRVNVEAVVTSGDWLVVSGLRAAQGSITTGRLPGTRSFLFQTKDNTISETSLVVLLRADRVYASDI